LEELIARVDKDTRVIVEAGGNAFYIASYMQPHVRDVTVVHPAKTRSIAASKIKTDKCSAETLARLLASGYVSPVWIPSVQIQSERSLVAHRMSLVKMRTAYKNRVHAILYRLGIIYSGHALFIKKARLLLTDSLSKSEESEKTQVLSLLRLIDGVSDEIALIDGHLAYEARDREDVQLLLTIPGINVLGAMDILAEIGYIRRYTTPDHLASYAGLPRVHQTGKSMRKGGITHIGRNALGSFLVFAAFHLRRRPGKIQDFYHRLLPKGKKVALVACARKILVIMILVIIWNMLVHKKPFRDNDLDLTRRKSMMIARSARPYPLEHSPHVRALVTPRT
jgi:transposase